jgi:hypothetical protein
MTRTNLSSSIKKKLRDPIWQFVGVILAFISLLTPLIIASLLSSPTKQIPNRIIMSSETSKYLTDFSEPVSKRMRVLIDNKEERDLRLFVFRIEYKGNAPVRSADFEIPIRGRIPSNRKLVSVQKASNLEGPTRFNKETGHFERDKKPSINFEVEILDEHSFQIKPTLMNPGEWLGIEIYTATADNSNSVPITDSAEKYRILSSEVTWSCHVAGVECPGTLDLGIDFDYLGFNAPWYLQVYVTHEGWSVYAILLFSIMSLLSMVLLAKAAGLQEANAITQILLFSIAIASSITSAEVAADWLFPDLLDIGQPILAWVIFWLNISAIIVLAIVAIWRKKRKAVRP